MTQEITKDYSPSVKGLATTLVSSFTQLLKKYNDGIEAKFRQVYDSMYGQIADVSPLPSRGHARHREMSTDEFRFAAELARRRIPHIIPDLPPAVMLAKRPWIDAISFEEISRRFCLPVAPYHIEVFQAVLNQSEIDSFGPPDEVDLFNTQELKIKALKILSGQLH